MYLRSFVRNNNNIRRIIILLGDGYIYIHKSYIYRTQVITAGIYRVSTWLYIIIAI